MTGWSASLLLFVHVSSRFSYRNNNRQAEIKELTSKGILPHEHELQKRPEISAKTRPWLIGRVAASIHDVKPAKQIVDEMVAEAAQILSNGAKMVSSTKAKL
jgi:hypothetical protein